MAVFAKTEEELVQEKVALRKEQNDILNTVKMIITDKKTCSPEAELVFRIDDNLGILSIEKKNSRYHYKIGCEDIDGNPIGNEIEIVGKEPWKMGSTKSCPLFRDFSDCFDDIGFPNLGKREDADNLRKFRTELELKELELKEKLGESTDTTVSKHTAPTETMPTGKDCKIDKIYYLELASGTYFFIDLEDYRTGIVQVLYNKKSETFYLRTKQIYANCALTDWVVNEGFLGGEETRYSCTINYSLVSKDEKRLKNLTINELTNKVIELAHTIAPKLTGEMISSSLALFHENDKVEYITKPAWDGFFYINDELSLEGRNYVDFEKEDVAEALQLLEQFVEEDFSEFKNEIAVIIRWIMMSPFSFAKKQAGVSLIQSMYCYGKSRAGKSILGMLIMHIWERKRSQVEFGIGSANTLPRLRVAMSESTYPIVIDEGEVLFYNPDLVNALKVAVENIWFGSTYTYTGSFARIPALSQIYVTSNATKAKKMELAARFQQLFFDLEGTRSSKEKKAFDAKWKAKSEDGPLKALSAIGKFTTNIMLNESHLLKEPWMDVSTDILMDMYRYAGMDTPDWIRNFELPDTTEEDYEVEEHTRVNLLITLIEKLGRMSYGPDPGTLKTDVNNGITEDEAKSILIRGRIERYVDNGHVPFLTARTKKHGTDHVEEIIMDNGVERAFYKEYNESVDIKLIAKSLGGSYGRRRINGSRQWVGIFNREEFLALWETHDIDE